ncbi:MAG: PAS domain S-box protein [Ignavibacteriales bacterium]|nr:PAS domain S-box protein [Ignavibacteriales bacterium]
MSQEDATSSLEVFDFVPLGMFFVDEEFRIRFWNRAIEDMTGKFRAEILGERLDEIYPHLKNDRYSRRIRQLFEGGPPILFSAQLHGALIPSKTFDGQDRSQHTYVALATIGPERTKLAVFSVQDVTDEAQRISAYRDLHRRALREIQEKQRAYELLEKSEAKFKAVFDSAAVGIEVIGLDGVFRAVNKRLADMLGYPPEELIGMHAAEVSPPEDRNKMRGMIEGFQDREPFAGMEKRYLRKGGEIFEGELHVAAIKDADGKTELGVGIVLDVSRRKAAERNAERRLAELTRSKERLEESAAELRALNDRLARSETRLRDEVATKDKLFSIIAHDLRNPFNAIIGIAEVLSRFFDTYTREETKRRVEELRGAARTANDLLENLLQWSRAQRGALVVEPECVEVAETIERAARVIRRNAEAKGVALETNCVEDLRVKVDLNMFETVVRNLLTNAVKFTPRGGEVRVCARKSPGGAIIEVIDSGVGIAEADRRNLFDVERTVSTYGTENEKGTGLGLALCRDFVELNGGKIDAESEEGMGSRFYFTLPFCDKRDSAR